MRVGGFLSLLLHLAILLLILFGLPDLFKTEEVVAPVAVQLATLADITAQPKPKPTPPTPVVKPATPPPPAPTPPVPPTPAPQPAEQVPTPPEPAHPPTEPAQPPTRPNDKPRRSPFLFPISRRHRHPGTGEDRDAAGAASAPGELAAEAKPAAAVGLQFVVEERGEIRLSHRHATAAAA
jgi:outer membrane biosynthesis protein TonB